MGQRGKSAFGCGAWWDQAGAIGGGRGGGSYKDEGGGEGEVEGQQGDALAVLAKEHGGVVCRVRLLRRPLCASSGGL